jgi:gliding motility-associated-like protein
MLMILRRALPLLIWLVGSTQVFSQDVFTMAGGSGQSCQGVLYDSGGQGASGYQDGENYTFTICPDVPGNVIYLTFFNFALNTSGPNPIDNLSIYDGDNTGATSLGNYTGNSLQNIIVSGTVFNTTGCLTLVFQSNANGTGVFAAGFQCTIPCQNPTAVATMSEPVPALVCQDEVMSFDGSGSTAQPGYTLVQYLWDFDDGTMDSTSGPFVTHAFDTPGEHVVQLFVTDDNGCGNLNLVDQQVLVSTTPNFGQTSASEEICFGETVDLVGAVEPTTWTGIPDANFGDGVFLPDDVGQPFSSSLLFTQFDPGQTVTSTDDILSICVDMEHTYMGDLVLQVICPNGQTMIFHQQGGGYTYLGSPNDLDNNDAPIIGECWHYCWSPTATAGTWVDNSVFGTSNTTQAGTPASESLNPGTYEPVQPFSNLIGCPLNGEWTYQSTDLWGADNGFICAWEINFDPNIIPDVTTFTPVLGTDCDSSWWTGPDMTVTSPDCDNITIVPVAPGSDNYVYSVIDNFGCTYDTTITVTVNEPFTVNAGPDEVICNDPVQLSATVVNGQGDPMTWSWTPTDGLSDPDISNPTSLVTSNTTYTVTAFITGHPDCTASDQVTVSLDPGLDPGLDTLVVVCATPPTFNLTDMLGGTPAAGGVWTDANGMVIPSLFDPTVDAAGVYTYTVTTALGCVGTADLEIQILGASDPSCCGVVDAGPDSTVCSLTYNLSASVGNTGGGNWSGPAGYTFNNANSPTAQVSAPGSGPAMFYWIEDDGQLCYLIDSVTITFTAPLQIDLALTNALCFDSCDGTATVTMSGGNGAFTYAWSAGVAGATDAVAIGLCLGAYSLDVTDVNGCTTSATYSIQQPNPLQIDGTSFVEPWCHGDCNGTMTIVDAEATEYSFDAGVSFTPEATRTAVCAGTYDVMIHNALGCPGFGQIVVTEPPEVVAEFDHVPVPANVDAPTVTFYNLSQNASAYVWDIAGLLTTSEPALQYTFSNTYPGVYPVCLVAIDTHGCTDTVCHDVVIDDVLQTYVPNSFTPDGDGINDGWWMVSNIPDMADFQLQVFDRWGRIVHETTDPYEVWNGTHMNGGGDVMKQDMYAYRITFQIISTGGGRELMGHVSLLK